MLTEKQERNLERTFEIRDYLKQEFETVLVTFYKSVEDGENTSYLFEVNSKMVLVHHMPSSPYTVHIGIVDNGSIVYLEHTEALARLALKLF
jgi:hypothetical protein